MFLNASKVECTIIKDGKSKSGKIVTNTIYNMVFCVPKGKLEKIQIKLKFDENVIVPKAVTLSINQYLMNWLDFECILKDKKHKVYLKEKFNSLLTNLSFREDTYEIVIQAKNVCIPKDTNMHMFSNYVEY